MAYQEKERDALPDGGDYPVSGRNTGEVDE